MPLQIDIAVRDDHWPSLISELEAIARSAVMAVFSQLKDKPDGELSIGFVDDEAIQTLNREFRAKNKPTNVLSFPQEHPLLGDIVLARETIEAEAIDQEKPIENHLAHLVIHGFLHLLGYDHMDDKNASIMESLEIKALAEMGIDNPYEINDFQIETK